MSSVEQRQWCCWGKNSQARFLLGLALAFSFVLSKAGEGIIKLVQTPSAAILIDWRKAPLRFVFFFHISKHHPRSKWYRVPD
jgi:hypothetical protein